MANNTPHLSLFNHPNRYVSFNSCCESPLILLADLETKFESIKYKFA